MSTFKATSATACPFCGEAESLNLDDIEPGEWHVCCDTCGAGGPEVVGEPAQAEVAWNTRAPAGEEPAVGPRPCPFCGGGDLQTSEVESFYVACQVCQTIGPPHPSEQGALARWNGYWVTSISGHATVN